MMFFDPLSLLIVGTMLFLIGWEGGMIARAVHRPPRPALPPTVTARPVSLLFNGVLRLGDIPALHDALPAYSFAICPACRSLHFTDGLYCGTCGEELDLSQGEDLSLRADSGFHRWWEDYAQRMETDIPKRAALLLYRQWKDHQEKSDGEGGLSGEKV